MSGYGDFIDVINEVYDKLNKSYINQRYINIHQSCDAVNIDINVGGMSGGDCYGSKATAYVGYTENPPNVERLILDILLETNDEIDIRTAIEIIDSCIESNLKRNSDYYDNYSNIRRISIYYNQIYDLLKENGYMLEDDFEEKKAHRTKSNFDM